jgi:UPF0176 protein
MFVVAAFYQFKSIAEPKVLQEKLLSLMTHHGIKGTLILAFEGVNSTVCGSRKAIDALKAFLIEDAQFVHLEYKESLTKDLPFKRLKVQVRKEIVTLGQPVDINDIGTYVSPRDWNDLLKDPEVVVLDVRNDFEHQMGTFKNAINPKTKFFSEFPEFVKNELSPKTHKKIAMSCTGGIRCEKASALMKQMGFEQVFHLKGGVLKYLEEVPKSESMWQGECFIFDERVSLDHKLEPKSYPRCKTCGQPILKDFCPCEAQA